MITPRPAATLILVRDGADGIEVLLMQRTHQAAFMPGVWVFPGGAVDDADMSSDDLQPHCGGMDDAAACRALGVDRGGLGYYVAAVRECFEEAGVLLARDGEGRYPRLDDPAERDAYLRLRQQMMAGELTLAELCQQTGLSLALDRLGCYAHWITPLGMPRRFDTRFFVAVAPEQQLPSHDGAETIDHCWINPAEALERNRRRELPLGVPTRQTLKSLAGFATCAALLEHVGSRKVEPIRPIPAQGSKGERIFHPDDAVYAELSRIDPEGRGIAHYEIEPGRVTALSPRVQRLTAGNPGAMTGPGTNTYLIGAGDEIAVIDPGPAMEEHVERIVEAAGRRRIRWILVTHTHMDHSPAAALLKAQTGAEVVGMPAPPHAGQDQAFAPDRVPEHGDVLELAGCSLRVLHTPGHASNHLCYLLQEEKLLFSGDHIMQGSTVVINPPDGHMGAYLDSLRALLDEDISHIAPAHGFLLDRPERVVDWLVAHRLGREAKVLDALRKTGGGRTGELVPLAYSDVHEGLHGVAERSMLAHLIKLRDEGVVTCDGDYWSIAPARAGLS